MLHSWAQLLPNHEHLRMWSSFWQVDADELKRELAKAAFVWDLTLACDATGQHCSRCRPMAVPHVMQHQLDPTCEVCAHACRQAKGFCLCQLHVSC